MKQRYLVSYTFNQTSTGVHEIFADSAEEAEELAAEVDPVDIPDSAWKPRDGDLNVDHIELAAA